MGWVHDLAEERRSRELREKLIEEHTPNLWVRLSECIDECVREYAIEWQQEKPAPTSNGKQPYTKTVTTFEFYDPKGGTYKDRVVATFSKANRAVTAIYNHNRAPREKVKKFSVAVMTDGEVIGFKDEHGRELTPEDVCREVLQEVLYPDIPTERVTEPRS